MKDEVLQKVLDSDGNIIPRFDIVHPDGTVLAENVQLVLKNTILTPGTPLNKQNLLSDDTSRALGLDPATSTPDTAFMSIRSSIGFCPRVRISYRVGGTISVRNENTQETQQYAVPEKGYVLVDILEYGVYKFWGKINSTVTPQVPLTVDTVKLYTVELN